MSWPKKYYTVWDRKKEKVIAFGSGKECAATLGIKPKTFYCMVTRSRQRPNGKYEVVVEKEKEPEG